MLEASPSVVNQRHATEVTLDEFPEALRQSFQYRFVRERAKEWGIKAMAKTLQV